MLAATMLRAIVAEIADPARTPRSLTISYPAPPVAGHAEIAVEVVRRGRSVDTVAARLVQDGRVCTLALAVLGVGFGGPEFDETAAPSATPHRDAQRLAYLPDQMPKLMQHLDLRPGLGEWPFTGAERAETGGWMQLDDPLPVDAPVAALLLDAWLPAIFTRLTAPAAAPTTDLTIHFRRPLPDGPAELAVPVLGRFRTTLVRDGWMEEDGELWSAGGTLLAQSRQHALLLSRS